LTKGANTQVGGAAVQSGQRAASRDGRTRRASPALSWRRDGDQGEAGRVHLHSRAPVPEGPAHAPDQTRREARTGRDTPWGRDPGPSPPRIDSRASSRSNRRIEVADLEYRGAQGCTPQTRGGPPARRCG